MKTLEEFTNLYKHLVAKNKFEADRSEYPIMDTTDDVGGKVEVGDLE